MKSKAFSLALVVLAGALTFSCSNKELESRVAKLEGKLAAMENVATPDEYDASNPEDMEPEVKPDGPLPAFTFEKNSHDFGTIEEGVKAEYTFKFKNTGEAPLVISKAVGSCGCTVPSWPKEPIPVGGEGEIFVSFNSKGRPGMQRKKVTITANTFPQTTELNIQAQVDKSEESEEENPT